MRSAADRRRRVSLARAYLAIQAPKSSNRASNSYCIYINLWVSSTILTSVNGRCRKRGLDFEDAPRVFASLTVEVEDTRKDYGEIRMLCYGKLEGRRHIFSMRKANRREQDCLAPHFGFRP
jgi:uncharacterized DUF497 family protein